MPRHPWDFSVSVDVVFCSSLYSDCISIPYAFVAGDSKMWGRNDPRLMSRKDI